MVAQRIWSFVARRAQWCRVFVGIAAILVALLPSVAVPTVVHAQTFVIANGDGSGLINAITQANMAGGTNTIALAAGGDYLLTAVNNGNPFGVTANGLPQIASGDTLTILGNGATIRRDTAATTFRLFEVLSGGTMQLDNVVLRNGASRGAAGYNGLNGYSGQPDGNAGQSGSSAFGGAIANRGTLVVVGSLFTGNTATGGNGGYGGNGLTNCGLCVGGSGGTGGSGADGTGGAVYSTGTLTIANSTFTGNTAAGGNGGNGGNGGSGSFGSGRGGNGGNGGNGIGGAIFASGTATVVNATIAANTGSPGFGGTGGVSGSGIPAAHGLSGSSVGGIAGSAGTVTNTILASNTGIAANCAITLGARDGGHNLEFNPSTSCGLTIKAQTGDPDLGALANNGGPTQTLALTSGSPAIGAGDATVCGTGNVNGVDQRGMPRLASTCDIGAYQVQGTHLAASIAGGGTTGAPASLTVTLFDGYDHALAPYTGTVHIISSDPLAVLPGDYTFTGSGFDNGTHVLPVTLRTAGTQNVTVTDTLAGTLMNRVTAPVAPVVASVGPSSGGTAGGNHVTLSGVGFGTVAGNVAVTLGGSPAGIASVTNTQLVVTAPAHAAGAVNVVVVVSGQSATVTNGYTYGVTTALPGALPAGVTTGNPGALPAARTPGMAQGSPNSLPSPRP